MQSNSLTLPGIYNAVSIYCGISDFTVQCRERDLCYARHLYCFLSRKHTKEPWKAISGFIGGRDHTTAVHSAKTFQDLFDTEEKVRQDLINVRSILSI